MNFAIKNYRRNRKTRIKSTKHTDNEGLAVWASHGKKGDTMNVKPDDLDYDALRKLKGYIRIDNRWKAFVTHYEGGRIEFLHCGDAPSLKLNPQQP